jgi:hypothetical protein
VPDPHVPPIPQSPFTWQTAPAAQEPKWPTPPHVPAPHAALVWQATEVQTPPAQAPVPHCALEVQATTLQVLPPQVPPLQSALPVQVHLPATQARPVPQTALLAHAIA